MSPADYSMLQPCKPHLLVNEVVVWHEDQVRYCREVFGQKVRTHAHLASGLTGTQPREGAPCQEGVSTGARSLLSVGGREGFTRLALVGGEGLELLVAEKASQG